MPALRRQVDGRRPPHQFRSHTGLSLEDIPLHQANWIGALNALLREHNHRHSKKEKDVSFKTRHERREFYFRFFRELRDSGYNIDPRSLVSRNVSHVNFMAVYTSGGKFHGQPCEADRVGSLRAS